SVTRAFAVDVVALQVGALTITPSTLIDASVAAAPYPATYQMDGPAGATGVLLFFHHMGSWVGAIDIDGQPATRIGSAPSTRFSTGATESVCEVFYSASVSGSVTVSGGPSGVRAVVAGHITGGTLRSFELQTYTTPVADGDGGTAKVAHTYEGAGRQHDLSIFGIIGDQQAILSPPHSRIANWTGSFGAVDGAVFVSPLIADGDFTLQTNNHNGYRQRYGSWLLVASQYPQDRVVTDPPPIERYVYPLRQADLSRADVPVSGTYTGVAATLEIRVVDGDGAGLTDWQAVTGVSGAWTATVTVPRPAAATAMHVETRFAGGDRSWVQGDPWTIGLHLAEMGQSNKSGELLGGGGADVVARPGFGMLYSTATGTFVPGGKGWWAFCNTFTDLTGVPVLGVYSTQDGSPASAFIPGTVQYANLRAGVASLDSPIHAFRWHQGEGDAATARADQYPVSQYYGHLAAIRDQIAADTGRASGDDLPIIVEGLSTYGGASPTTDQRWTNMQRTLADIAGTIPGGVFGNCRTDLVRADTYHAYGASFATTSAPRSAYEVARALGLLSGPSTTDFRIASASATNATTTTINVQHGPGSAMAIVGLGHGNGTGLVTEGLTSAPSAFEVWDGAAWIAATATITGAATISLDHASIPTAGRRIRHLHGMDPCSDGLIRDDSAYHSPLMMTHDLACT
ncbi:MAG: hypothetical protein Q4G49_16405, partial [Paracoccus sp. (in: a-proteobacteria)]|nr:hypothetical protein [Paracoccus sp. (in: a-proteobacteria)]